MRSPFASIMLACVLFSSSFARADVPVRVVRFNDVKPANVKLSMTFEGIGLDPQERVYAYLCGTATTPDCHLVRWDPQTGEKQYLGSLGAAAARAGNLGPNQHWPKREFIVKGHTHVWHLDGKMWMGTMNAHDYQDMSVIRGGHLMAYDLATGVITDHSQWQPKGVFKDRGGFYAIPVYPPKNVVVGIGVPNSTGCEIIVYNPRTRATKRVRGLPAGSDNGQLAGRDAAVTPDGKVLYQCGPAGTAFGLYDINTGENRATSFRAQKVLTSGIQITSDGSKAYVTDLKNIYEFNLQTGTQRTLTPLDPTGAVRQTSAAVLSRDEQKLYYVINQSTADGGAWIEDLYEYTIATRTRIKLRNLKDAIGPAKVSSSHSTASNGRIYFVFRPADNAGILEVDVSDRTGPAPARAD